MLNIFITILFATLCFLIRYHWSRRRLYKLANKMYGPTALPIIGNGLLFNCKTEDILDKLKDMIDSYESPSRFWLGPQLLVCFKNPDQVEKILTSSKITYKHEIYDFLKPLGGEAMITGSGPKWKKHRKITQPLINLKFINSNIRIFKKQANICAKNLEKFVDGDIFNILPTIQFACIDIISETMFGIDMKSQTSDEYIEFIQATIDMYDVFYARMIKPWLHPNILYSLTPHKAKHDHIIETVNTFMANVVRLSRLRVSQNFEKLKNIDRSSLPMVDQLVMYAIENPEELIYEDIAFDVATLYTASEDTIAVVVSFTCFCLGMYPEYQKKVAEEIREVFGETQREVLLEDLPKLTYLDMCIKEAQRIVPAGPYILRSTTEEFQIDEWTLPTGLAVCIALFNLHRDPNQWENPDHYYPDHFLPEAVKKRHPYSFIPFSAGPRSCIGKTFATTSIKVMLANILQKYEFEAEGKLPDIKLRADISVRPSDGYNVKLRRRKWH